VWVGARVCLFVCCVLVFKGDKNIFKKKKKKKKKKKF
jgi:hypothetical protein